jgi:hypothetical protein
MPVNLRLPGAIVRRPPFENLVGNNVLSVFARYVTAATSLNATTTVS